MFDRILNKSLGLGEKKIKKSFATSDGVNAVCHNKFPVLIFQYLLNFSMFLEISYFFQY